MVPGAFVVLESLPLTPSGKLDRRALPAPELDAYVSRAYEAPQGEVEEILSGIWQDLLHVERAGRNDNFFELGGHSLLIVKLTARIADALVVHVSVITVFRHPTIQQLAKIIHSIKITNTGSLSSEVTEFDEGVI
jgi:syringomycin synthetase protein SyrE